MKKIKFIKLKSTFIVFAFIILSLIGCNNAKQSKLSGSPLANKEYEKLTYNSEEKESGEFFGETFNKYSDLLIEYADYLGVHQSDISDGKKFSDVYGADYEEEMDDYYEFMYEVMNFDTNGIPDDYRNIWDAFSGMIAENKAVFEDAYDKEVNEAFDLIGIFLTEATTTSNEIGEDYNEILASQDLEFNDLIPTISLGEKVTTKSYEFILNKVELSYKIEPDTDSIIYSYYEAESGQIYIHIDADIKNLQKQSIRCDEIYIASADYNEGYLYDGFPIVEDADGDFTYANITEIDPLQTLGVHSLIDCPDEVNTNKDAPLFILITLDDGQQYKYAIRE